MSQPKTTAALLASALALALGCTTIKSCAPSSGGSSPSADPGQDAAGAPDEQSAKIWGYRVVKTYPHDKNAYTQGLLWDDGFLIETTGRPYQSFLRKVELETGKVVQSVDLPGALFGEGVAKWKGLYIQLTWQAGEAIVWDAKSFRELYRYKYEGEGWGLTLADDELVMSDGTSKLQIRDPKTFKLKREVPVTIWNSLKKAYVPVDNLNELEWIDGEVWANIYQDESIVRIDLETGYITSFVDFKGLQAKQKIRDKAQDVQNGIAHDPKTGRLFITGKYWPNLYEIELVERQ